MEPRAVREMASHLATGEKLIWAGSPAPRAYAMHGSGWRIAVALGAMVFAGGAMASVLVDDGAWAAAPLVRVLLLALAAGIALALWRVVSRPLDRFREASRIVYGLTDRRAVLIAHGAQSRIEDVPAARFEEPVLRRNRDGTVNVLFFRESRLAPGASPHHAGIGLHLAGFLGIAPDPALVKAIAAIVAKREDRTP